MLYYVIYFLNVVFILPSVVGVGVRYNSNSISLIVSGEETERGWPQYGHTGIKTHSN